jgi:hypothetical protein
MSTHSNRGVRARVHRALLGSLVVLSPVIACSKTSTMSPLRELAAGRWGSPDAGLLVADTATTFAFSCARGRAPSHITLDAQGHFAVDGTLTSLAGPAIEARGVRYVGTVTGSSLTLTVIFDPSLDVRLGPFVLQKGATGPDALCA